MAQSGFQVANVVGSDRERGGKLETIEKMEMFLVSL